MPGVSVSACAHFAFDALPLPFAAAAVAENWEDLLDELEERKPFEPPLTAL